MKIYDFSDWVRNERIKNRDISEPSDTFVYVPSFKNHITLDEHQILIVDKPSKLNYTPTLSDCHDIFTSYVSKYGYSIWDEKTYNMDPPTCLNNIIYYEYTKNPFSNLINDWDNKDYPFISKTLDFVTEDIKCILAIENGQPCEASTKFSNKKFFQAGNQVFDFHSVLPNGNHSATINFNEIGKRKKGVKEVRNVPNILFVPTWSSIIGTIIIAGIIFLMISLASHNTFSGRGINRGYLYSNITNY